MKGKIIYLDCPVMATSEEITYIRSILSSCDNLGVYASNYYALTLCDREKTIVSSEMNVVNNYSLAFYQNQGFNKVVISKENFDFGNLSFDGELFKEDIAQRLIYFRHCPIKEHFGGNCNNCKFHENIVYKLGNNKLTLIHRKIYQCQFYLRGICKKFDTTKGRVVENI